MEKHLFLKWALSDKTQQNILNMVSSWTKATHIPQKALQSSAKMLKLSISLSSLEVQKGFLLAKSVL